MMRTAAILLALFALASAASPAAAQSLDVAGREQGRAVREITIPVAVQGQVSVEFHGQGVPGCQVTSSCTTSGLTAWSPGTRGTLVVTEYALRGRRWLDGALSFSDRITTEDVGRTGPLTVARVDRVAVGGVPHTCSDARVNGFFDVRSDPLSAAAIDIRIDGGSRTVSTTDLVGTRCAGPLQSDIEPLLPVRRVQLVALMAGRTTLDMSTARPLAVPGFAGTVRSSVILRLGTPAVKTAAELAAEHRRFSRAFGPEQTVTIEYDVERVSGEILVTYSSLAEQAQCAPLDACGSSGTLRVAPATSAGEAYLYAIGARRLPRDRLRAALGLAPGRAPRSVLANGVAFWSSGVGSVTQAGLQAGERCSDTAPLRADAVSLIPRGDHVSATYDASDPSFDQLQTRCAGPSFVGVDVPSLASAQIPLRRFTRSRVRVRLDRGRSFHANGYSIRTRAALTLSLKRKRIFEQVSSAAARARALDPRRGPT